MDRKILNTDLNQDLSLSVNVGGTQTEALKVYGSSGKVYIPNFFSDVVYLTDASLDTAYATEGSFGSLSTPSLSATTGSLGSLLATSGSISSLQVTTGSISSLLATSGSMASLLATSGSFTSASVGTGSMTTANVTTANITTANVSLTNPGSTSSASSLTLTSASPDLVVMTGGSSVKLPGDVLLGRTFKIINTSASPLTVQTSASTTVALILAGKFIYATALQNNPTANSHWFVDASSNKQIEKSSSVASAITRTNTAYGAFSTNVALTFTAAVSGKYKIYTQASVDLSVTTSTYGLKIVATSGTPTDYWSPQNASLGTLITGTSRQQVFVQKIDTLVAGTPYTYALYGASTSGTLTLKGDLAEIVLIAELME